MITIMAIMTRILASVLLNEYSKLYVFLQDPPSGSLVFKYWRSACGPLVSFLIQSSIKTPEITHKSRNVFSCTVNDTIQKLILLIEIKEKIRVQNLMRLKLLEHADSEHDFN